MLNTWEEIGISMHHSLSTVSVESESPKQTVQSNNHPHVGYKYSSLATFQAGIQGR